MDLTGIRNMKSSNEEKIKKTLKTTIVILSVIYMLLPVHWLIPSSCVWVLGSLFLLFFDVLNNYSSKSLEYKYKANLLSYEKNLYQAKESGFKGFAFRCERFME